MFWFVWDPKHETLRGGAWSVSPSAPVRTSGAEWARNSLLPFRSTLSSLFPFRLRLCPFSPPSLTPAQGKYLTENTRHSNKSNMSNVWGTYTPGFVADLKWDWTFWFASSQIRERDEGEEGRRRVGKGVQEGRGRGGPHRTQKGNWVCAPDGPLTRAGSPARRRKLPKQWTYWTYWNASCFATPP